MGALIRAATPSVSPSGGTRIYAEGIGSGTQATSLRFHLRDETGLWVTSADLPLGAGQLVTVRILVNGDQVEVLSDGQTVIDAPGIQTPAGGGFTRFYAERGTAVGGSLGWTNVQVLSPGPKGEVHIDGDGVAWLTIYQPGIFQGGFSDPDFTLTIDNVLRLSFSQFVSLFWNQYAARVESLSDSHVTFGLQLPLPEGARIALEYGEVDEAFVPWW